MLVIHVVLVLCLAQLMCLAWGGVGGEGSEWMRGLDLGFTNLMRTW